MCHSSLWMHYTWFSMDRVCAIVGNKDYNGYNTARMAEVWMGMYKENFYLARGDLKVSDLLRSFFSMQALSFALINPIVSVSPKKTQKLADSLRAGDTYTFLKFRHHRLFFVQIPRTFRMHNSSRRLRLIELYLQPDVFVQA